jgi:hypothetical protein
MAVLGALIVFSGLAVLSFVISQLPRLFSVFEKRPPVPTPESETQPPERPPPFVLSGAEPENTDRAAAFLEPLVQELDAPFLLTDLYQQCRRADVPHPHLTLSLLRRANILVDQGDGVFMWKFDPTTR